VSGGRNDVSPEHDVGAGPPAGQAPPGPGPEPAPGPPPAPPGAGRDEGPPVPPGRARDEGPAAAQAARTAEAADGAGAESATVEELIEELEAVINQRDEYLALARAKQAEFENYRKQMMRRQADHLEQAAAGLVDKLLPVLDAFDYGVAHGDEGLAPLQAQLLGVLEKEGLERIAPLGEAFDPAAHEAVMHEAGEGGPETVSEVLRAGYRWNGRLMRPAMVKVRG